MDRFGQVVEDGRNRPLPTGSSFCDTDERRLMGKCTDAETARAQCPAGFKFVSLQRCEPGSVPDQFLEAVGAVGRKYVPVCERTLFGQQTPAQLLDCCVDNEPTATRGNQCPPGYCVGQVGQQQCFDVWRKHCLDAYEKPDGSTGYDAQRLFFDKQCQNYVLDEAVRNGPEKRKVADWMRKVCLAAGRFAPTTPLCRCVVSTVEEFCEEDKCFARMNRNLAEQAACLATDCMPGFADERSYIPPEPEGGCRKAVCAPFLDNKCVKIQSKGDVAFFALCEFEGEVSDERAAELKQKYGITDKDLEQARRDIGRGVANRASGQKDRASGQKDGSDVPTDDPLAKIFGNGHGDGNGGGGNGSEETGLSSGAIVGVAVGGVLLLVIIVALIVYFARRQHNSQSYGVAMPTSFMVRPPPGRGSASPVYN